MAIFTVAILIIPHPITAYRLYEFSQQYGYTMSMKKLIHIAGLAIYLIWHSVGNAADLWDIYQLAIKNDATYRAAQAEFAAAKLNSSIANSARLPALQAIGSRSRTVRDAYDNENVDNDQVLLRADWTLFDHSLNRAVAQAKIRVAQAELRFTAAQHELMLRVTERYVGWLSAYAQLEVARRHKAAINRQLTFANERLAVGVGTITDVYDAQARFGRAIAEEIAAQNAIENAGYALREITGRDIQSLARLKLTAPLPTPQPNSPESWAAKAAEYNIDIQIAKLQLQIADHEISKIRGQRLPTFGLRVDRLRRSEFAQFNPATSIPNQNRDTTTAIAMIEWQLFAGGAIFKRTTQANLQFQSTEYIYQQTRRQVESAVVAAYLAITGAKSRIRALSDAVLAGENSVQSKLDGFRAGLTTNLEVLDAERDLARSQTDQLIARYDFIVANLRLKQLAGELSDTDIKQINLWFTDE